MRDAWCVMRDAWCVMRDAWCVMRDAWCVMRDDWCVMRDAWCVMRDAGVRCWCGQGQTVAGELTAPPPFTTMMLNPSHSIMILMMCTQIVTNAKVSTLRGMLQMSFIALNIS
jgi:hypothetical protein